MDLGGAGPGAGDRGLTSPGGLALSMTNVLAVADTGNNRVLLWNALPAASGTPADLALGQIDFAGTAPDRGGSPSASTLDTPASVMFRDQGIVVVDQGNHRVLLYSSVPTASGGAADGVLGQANFAGALANRGTTPADDTLKQPSATCSAGDVLAVVDTGNHRVLIFRPFPAGAGAHAVAVLGQDDFGAAVAETDAQSLRGPTACAFITDALCVADTGNNRVVRFTPVP